MFKQQDNQMTIMRVKASRWAGCVALAIGFLLSSNIAEAGLVTVTSVTDRVTINDPSAGVSGDVDANTLTGNTVLIGDNNYISILFSDFDEEVGLVTDWTQAFPETATTSATITGSTEVTFTVNEQLEWVTEKGGDDPGTFVNNDLGYSLFDETTMTFLVDTSKGSLNGNPFDNQTGNLGSDTGGPFLMAGHEYTWKSYFNTAQWQTGFELEATSTYAQLTFSPTGVPEPSSLLMLGSVVGFTCSRRRKK